MKKEIVTCDECGKQEETTEWVRQNPNIIFISWVSVKGEYQEFDFCSQKCLLKFYTPKEGG